MKTLSAHKAGWLCLTLAAGMALNPMHSAIADELDDLIDNPSAYCQDAWVQVANALKGDAKSMAEWRDQYAQFYADCMQSTAVEIAKRRKETSLERQARQDVDRWFADCLQGTKEYVSRQIDLLPKSYSDLDREGAKIRYFKFYLSQCMDSKRRAYRGTP